MKTEITRELVGRVLETVNAGLVGGLGERRPGSMCVEAAVCYALDLPHGDQPTCVGSAVRSFMIRMNDATWPTDVDRTNTLRKLSVAQLGSDSIDQVAFARLVTLGMIQKVVPIALRAAARVYPKHTENLKAHAKKCEAVQNLEDGSDAADAAAAAAAAAATAAEAAAAATAAKWSTAATAAATAEAAAAVAEAAAAATAAKWSAAVAAAADAADAADAAVAAVAAVAAAAAADAAKWSAARLQVLQITAEIGLQALIELQSPGVQFLDLCE